MVDNEVIGLSTGIPYLNCFLGNNITPVSSQPSGGNNKIS